MLRAAALLFVFAPLAVAGCGAGAESDGAAPERGSAPAPATAPGGELPRVVVLGDSLAAGYGLPEAEAFPAVLEELLAERGRPARVVNAGVSGDTSAGGLARLDWVLRQRPQVLLVELGANDGLRGLSPAATETNLRAIVERARDADARVVLAGMRMPPSLGPDFVRRFEAVYPRLARELDVELVPFLLEGVGGVARLNLPDGIHPTAEGHRIVAATVLPYVLEALAG